MTLSFEDFTPGWTRKLGPFAVTEADIVGFAREYDPQPFHVDPEAAKATFVGRLIASGWHTCSLNMRLLADGFLLDTASMGAPGIEEVKWLRPVLPGDALSTVATVLESRASKSRPDLGLVRFGFEMTNQRGEVVFTQANWILIGRRGAPPPAGVPRPPSPSRLPDTGVPEPAVIPYLEELTPGGRHELGSFTFGADDIVRFGRLFDPQPFHVDPEAAKASLFGGLCASGWQTAATWMKLMIASRDRSAAEAARQGRPMAQLGPSPGFKNLTWSKPVYAGDTVSYSSTVTGTRPSASRPGWGFASHRNRGVNQHGEEVFGFDGTVFWQMRP
jgi:acyl dehydratase